MIHITEHRIQIPFPAKETPAWAPKSDRWYQLDAAAYSLAQGYELLKDSIGPQPDFIILASPLASNATDRDFALAGASSPSKFVHTLPNIRAVSLLQVMGWAGPLLCVQDDPKTLESGLVEARYVLEAHLEYSRVWVVSFEPRKGVAEFYVVTRTSEG